ncbi:MAG: 30S ribosomal protein S14 [Candidatus Diapherotrites archaeon]|nr:30S ribosomal protein S14 [Candidatus Diapherotrites archaeon]
MSKQTERKRWRKKCSICGRYAGVMQRYGMVICWRCFKHNAEKLGFRKYD